MIDIRCGDAFRVLRDLEAQSHHTCVTSPPYYGLRKYGNDPLELGRERTPAEYVENLVSLFRQVRRVLRADGTLWLNLGDSYARMGGTPAGEASIVTNNGERCRMNKLPPGVKEKDLLGMPWRVALALQADGWYLRSDIIWEKPNPMPENVDDRPSREHEYLFLLSPSAQYYYDAVALMEPVTGGANARISKAMQRQLAAERESDEGQTSLAGISPKVQGQKERYIKQNSRFTSATALPVLERNRRTIWRVPASPFKGAHFAVMPVPMAEDCIKAGTSSQVCATCGAPFERQTRRTSVDRTELPPDHREYRPRQYDLPEGNQSAMDGRGKYSRVETLGWEPSCDCAHSRLMPNRAKVLDPFGGAASTGLAADRLGRDATLIELYHHNVELSARRLHDEAPLTAQVHCS
jgi:DNA modification methylase